jgi:hypothetical protein
MISRLIVFTKRLSQFLLYYLGNFDWVHFCKEGEETKEVFTKKGSFKGMGFAGFFHVYYKQARFRVFPFWQCRANLHQEI